MRCVRDGMRCVGAVTRWRRLVITAAIVVGVALVAQAGSSPAAASTLPTGFRDSVVLSGLSNPTVLQFAPDGRIFVGQKNGVIKVFQSLTDTNPVTVADLSGRVHDFWDRGLLGMALPANFPASPYVYVLYAYDAPIGGTPPTWGDGCPTPPGPTTDGCLVSGRLSRLQISGNVMTGSEQVLINDWCQQFPSHSIGTLLFGRDGYLYVTGGDGASFNNVDYGQYGAIYAGDRANPCGDPPGAVGTPLSAPGAEGGALRSQSVRRTDGPATLDGAVLRLDPATGAGVPGNPFFSSSDANARRIVAYGLRNPFRMTQRPGTDELWVGDVGWGTWEEINRVGRTGQRHGVELRLAVLRGSITAGRLPGRGPQLVLVAVLDARFGPRAVLRVQPQRVRGELHRLPHGRLIDHRRGVLPGRVLPGDTTTARCSSPTTPATRSGRCSRARTGCPTPPGCSRSWASTRMGGAAGHPVDLKIGPGGDLFYVDMEGGTVHRITFTAANQPPTAVITASPTNGPVPLTVSFDGSGSSDPEGRPLSYSWDLNGDGTFGDATGSTASYTYTAAGVYHPSLRVTDDQGASDTESVTVTAGNTAPTAVIDSPPSSLTWKVGDPITFSGHATDTQDGTLPASALSWSLILHHCFTPTDCHAHLLQTINGVASGSVTAPDHAYPCWLELRLTATDSSGLTSTTSVRLDPKTVVLTFKTNPGGLVLSNLVVNEAPRTTPFSVTVVVGSANSVSAPSPQQFNKSTYYFTSWSDGGAQSHTITAPAVNTTYTATYRKQR